MSDVKINYIEFLSHDLVASNGVICREIKAFPGGRRFHFLEPGGNAMGVWSDTDSTGEKIA